MRVSLVFLLLLACSYPAHGQKLADIHPQSKRDLRNHSRWYIRTPDGTVWDMWGEQQYLEVFNDSVESRPIRQRRSQGTFIEMVTIGRGWVTDSSRESIAWEVPKPTTVSPVPSYYDRNYEGLPPLWRTIDGIVHPNFIYINERNPDIVSRENEVRSTWVTHDLGDNLFSVDVRQGRGVGEASRRLASRPTGSHFVYIDNPRKVIKDGSLTGEFILWLDNSIVPPPEALGNTYRYLPISELRLTQEDLGKAVYLDEAELVSWEYKRDGRFWRWTRRVHPLRYLDLAAIQRRRDAAKKRAAEQPPAPVLEPTHLLILVGNHYHYGRLISENETEVRFLVINGSMTAESVFPRDQIVILKEVSPPPPPPLDPER